MFLIIMGVLLLGVLYGLVRSIKINDHDTVSVSDNSYSYRYNDDAYHTPVVEVEKNLVLDNTKTDNSLDNFIPPRFYIPPMEDKSYIPPVDLLQPITASINDVSNTHPITVNPKRKNRKNRKTAKPVSDESNSSSNTSLVNSDIPINNASNTTPPITANPKRKNRTVSDESNSSSNTSLVNSDIPIITATLASNENNSNSIRSDHSFSDNGSSSHASSDSGSAY